MSEINYTAAKKVFAKIDAYLKSKNWKYDTDTDQLQFTYSVGGDDLPMRFTLLVDAERELIRLISFLPFNFDEDKRVDGAIAVCIANYEMVDGCFGFDIQSGTLYHRLAVPYKDNEITDDHIQYIMGLGMAMVDKYNDRFFALNKGFIDIAGFLKKK